MFAILLADDKHRNYHAKDFFRVYSDYVLEKLQERMELEPEPVFLSQFAQKKAMLRKVEVVFSNWGMPELTYEQVHEYLPNVKALFMRAAMCACLPPRFFKLARGCFAREKPTPCRPASIRLRIFCSLPKAA